jgi:RecG-like helicase
VEFNSPAFLVKLIMDVDFQDGQAIVMMPTEFLDPQQIREFQKVLEQRRIILLPPNSRLADPWEKNLRSVSH